MSFSRELREAILRQKGWRIVSLTEIEKLRQDIDRRREQMKKAS